MIGLDDKGYNPSTLLEEYSPSIPKDFPQSRIPKNLCEEDLVKLMKCTKFIAERDACQAYYTDFLNCKRKRDLEIFKEIKVWETDHYRNLSEQNRGFYTMGLGKKLERLESEYERIPTSYSYQAKAWCFKSDIEQIKWRLQYLKQEGKNILKEQQQQQQK